MNNKKGMIEKTIAFVQIFLVLSLVFVVGVSFDSQVVYAQEESVCCEKDNSGNYCSYVPVSQCTGGDVLNASTRCDQSIFCKPGCCASDDGFCYSSSPRALCENGYNGSYSIDNSCSAVNECKLGCCIIGTQAAYTTRNRCINETAAFPDLEVDFRDNVASEIDCLNLARNTDKGCCVTGDSCRFVAKSECNIDTVVNGTGFYNGTYCSTLNNLCTCASANPELGGSGDFKATTCLSNDDKVYWRDSCGNPEGIVQRGLSRHGGARDDGNCDYNTGTLCGDSNNDGIHVCESLDCQGGTSGVTRNENLSVNLDESYEGRGTPLGGEGGLASGGGIINGESWCEFDSPDQQQIFNQLTTADRQGKDPVGSRYYRHLCINGQELIEPCKDFREEYCYYNSIDVNVNISGRLLPKKYTESRCIINEWQPCTSECNTASPNTMSEGTYKEALKKDQQCCLSPKRDCAWTGNNCIPAVSPGFKFWESEGADVCARASTSCTATFVCGGFNRIFGACGEGEEAVAGAGAAVGVGGGAALYTGLTLGAAAGGPIAVAAFAGVLLVLFVGGGLEKGWQIVSGSECLSQDYLQASNNFCRAQGDCGADFNYLNAYGVEDKFTLSYAGFSNTENINSEIARYARENPDELQDAKSSDRRKDVDFTFVGGKVPGNLTEPSWTKGDQFFNFTTDRSGTGSKFVRAIFGDDEISATSAFSPGGVGIGSAIVASVLALGGSTAATSGAGLSITPIGYLVSKLIQLIPGVPDLGLNVARSAAARSAETAFAGAYERGSFDAAQKEALRSAIAKKYGEEVAAKATDADLQAIASLQQEGAEAVVVGEQEVSIEAQNELVVQASETYGEQQAATSFSGYLTGVSAAMWAYAIYQIIDVVAEDVKQVHITTTCQTWQAPIYRTTNDDPCQRCNPDYKPGLDGGYVNRDKTPKDVRAFKVCSEYRCKSLGPSCELINQGTTEETCVSINKLDTNSPKIEPWIEGFSLNITSRDIRQNATGFRITKEIPIYKQFNVGLKTDEPAQCKMSFEHSRPYETIENNFFGGNNFKYFHINQMMYPASPNSTDAGLTLTGGGHYKLYLRCTDAVGNSNDADYVIEFDVSKEPDLTAPTIVGSSLAPPVGPGLNNQTTFEREVYLMNGANYSDVTLFVNEPAECRYSYVPLDFNLMNETNACKTQATLLYNSCKFVRNSPMIAGIGPAPSGFLSRAGMLQYVYFKCRDHPEPAYNLTRNFNKDPYTIILKGSEPLTIDSSGPSGLIKTSSALVNVTLDVRTSNGALLNGNAICKYTTEERNKDNLASMTEFLNTNLSVHTQPWQPSSGLHKFFAGCYDVAGNRAFAEINFTVERDVIAPYVIRTYRDESFTPPQFVVEINEPGVCKDSVDGTFSFDSGGNLMNMVGVSGKIFSSTNAGSNVYYVVCRDQFNNTMSPATIQIAEV